jgi:hypothetical protein
VKGVENMKNLAKALVDFSREITNPPMNATNPFFKSRYTDLPTAIDHYKPILAKHGLTIVQMLGSCENGGPCLETLIFHEAGEMLSSKFPMQLPADPQKAGAAITYYRRYALNAAVLCAGDPDDDANSVSEPKKADKPKPKDPTPPRKLATDTPPLPKLTETQHKKIEALVGEFSMDRATVKGLLKIESMNDLTSQRASNLIEKWDSFVDLYNAKTGAADGQE